MSGIEMLAAKKPAGHRPSMEHMIPSEQQGHHSEEPMASAMLSHSMDPKDLENPMNWPLHRKIYTSAVAWMFAAAV